MTAPNTLLFEDAFTPLAAPHYALILPYRRSSYLHIPRRDIVVSLRDSLALRITVVESDNASALALELTGGDGGPSLSVAIWRDSSNYRMWDYGSPPASNELLWDGGGTLSETMEGTFDVFIPVNTFANFPMRCGWSVRLDFDGVVQSQMLAQGIMHITPAFGPAAASTAEVITTDALDPITTD